MILDKYRDRLLETLILNHNIEYVFQGQEIAELLDAGIFCKMRDLTKTPRSTVIRIKPTARRVLLGLSQVHLKNKQPWEEGRKK